MGVFTHETEYKSIIAPSKLFKAFVLDGDNLFPKIPSLAIKCTEVIKGDGGVGTIKKVHLGEGSEFNYVVHQVDGLDKDNFVFKYSIIEGDILGDKIEKISCEIKFVACEGGCIIKTINHYHCKGDFQIKEEHVKDGKDKTDGLFKLVEDYLVAHPEEYN